MASMETTLHKVDARTASLEARTASIETVLNEVSVAVAALTVGQREIKESVNIIV